MPPTPRLLAKIADEFAGTFLGLVLNGAELRGNGYQRAAVEWKAGDPGELTNASPVVFPEAIAPWKPADGLRVFAGASGDDDVWDIPGFRNAERAILDGQQLTFKAGDIVIRLAKKAS